LQKKFGLLGSNISYSLSPKIYDYWFKEYNIMAQYDLIDMMDIDTNILHNYAGFNITKPFKEKIIPFLKDLTTESKLIGSVNLVVDGVGYNTDYLGLLDSYQYYNISPNNKNILILGAGGAARAVIYSLGKFNANIFIYNRTPEKVSKIIENFKDLNIKQVQENIDFEIIFNATTLSFAEILKQVKIKQSNKIIYYDLNYYHKDKSNYIDGLYMLLSQARYNFEKFFGILPDVNPQLINFIKK
jgi:shikimate dehydrogenase